MQALNKQLSQKEELKKLDSLHQQDQHELLQQKITLASNQVNLDMQLENMEYDDDFDDDNEDNTERSPIGAAKANKEQPSSILKQVSIKAPA